MVNKKKAILIGPCIGEMYWEFARFAPLLDVKRKQYGNDVTYIVYTRPDRFDMYGDNCDMLLPLHIDGDNTLYTQDCYGLSGYKDYDDLIKNIYTTCSHNFDIIEHIYPDLSKASGAVESNISWFLFSPLLCNPPWDLRFWK